MLSNVSWPVIDLVDRIHSSLYQHCLELHPLLAHLAPEFLLLLSDHFYQNWNILLATLAKAALTDVVVFLVFAAWRKCIIQAKPFLQLIVMRAHDIQHLVDVLGAFLLLPVHTLDVNIKQGG